MVTLGCHRPLLTKEIDLKQMLVEGFQSEKLRNVVVFVCRILREGSKSPVFKITNPWVSTLLSILKEIKDSN
jgi:CCR4-NOT transcription complex subunit 1